MKKQRNQKTQNKKIIGIHCYEYFVSKVREYKHYCFLKLKVSSSSVGTAIVKKNWHLGSAGAI